ncbi:hypothetical protein V2A84_09620 [Yersinia sp. 2553 StPb PI]|uniref:hypothetical protein n=1 Tax=Yersinia sp. 2553 StPb PI TaxID=3117411 RepID=UPI003FA45ACA
MRIDQMIIRELYKALINLGADTHLLCIVGSHGDTQSDEDVLEMLQQYNEKGDCMHKIIAPTYTFKPTKLGDV